MLVSPEILCPDPNELYPWHRRSWGRRKLLRTRRPSAAPDRVVSLAVPADAFPTSSKIFSLPNYSSASLYPQGALPHVWHPPDLVLARGILLSGYRSRAKVTIILPSAVLLLDCTTLGPTNFSFLVLFFFEPQFCSPSSRSPSFLKCGVGPDMPPQETRYQSRRVYSSCLAVCALLSMSHSAVCPFHNSTTYLTDVQLVAGVALRFVTAVLLPKQIVRICAVFITLLQT